VIPQTIKKRDGRIVKFKVKKVIDAIEQTMLAVGIDDEELPKILAEKVIHEINVSFNDDHLITVEEVQDVVEKVLINESHAKMAKAFILYRQKRSELRKVKQNILGRFDDSKLNVNGLLIAKSRYLQKDNDGNVIETPKEMFQRVARSVAEIEKKYGKTDEQINEFEEEFYDMINTMEFIPGGRILANAGVNKESLYSSFVIPIDDSMKGIFKALYHKALLQKLGAGTGFSFSRIRGKGSKLASIGSYAAGPIAFIKLFDHASNLTVISGHRMPANMGSLSVDHPDIIEFITMKDRGEIKNFNISVEITEEFMTAVETNQPYKLKDPNTKATIDLIDANNIFHLIVTMAWKTGDPGVLFIDRINKSNPVPGYSRIETTDPCGDQLLLPYEGGNLGAINLSQFVRNKRIMWKQLEHVVKLSVRFLDNIVDLGRFPIKMVEDITIGTRRIGLGIMGFADMLYKLRIQYNSERALQVAEKVMKFISGTATEASTELAEEKGVFPMWEESIFKDKIKLRNASLLAIAPTGTRSILVDSSAGIEPNFALGYTRKVLGSTEILQINKVLEDVLKEHDIYSEEILRSIITTNSLEGVNLPQEVKEVFVTAHKISPEWHIKIQAMFQKYIDNAISKTVNFSKNATIEDIKQAFLMAYRSGCKGITVYREGSLNDQVINIGK